MGDDTATGQRILVVEDEENISSFVSAYLEREGYTVEVAGTAALARTRIAGGSYDLLLLDRMLPDADGLEICREVRSRDDQVPVVMLTARDEDVDKIVGLEVGADDYVTKPFNPRELVARIKATLRRAALSPPAPKRPRLQCGRIVMDAAGREALLDGTPVQLSPKEFDLLWELLEHQGVVRSRAELLESVWGYTFVGDTRTVDVHVRQLRRKLGDDCPIETVWGSGYKVTDDVTAA